MQILSHQRSISLVLVRKTVSATDRMPPHAMSAWTTIRRRGRGFTMVELMVTLTVAVVLLVIAIPSFRTMTLSNRLTTAVNDMVSAINVARLEAIKRNANTQFCSDLATNNTSDTLGTTCTTQTGAVYVATGATPTQVLAGTPNIAAPLQLSGNVTALRFTSQGVGQKAGTASPYGATVADICTSQLSSDNHRTISMTGGTILEIQKSTGACP
ncbi:GspH/FimT family pseudopilin [Dyella subtropica]|uniref:GspH/FimT family pseudopilin n=1 Tax=Dyella subtropica TaxID=2992127 RepID=UPI002255677C|nr:GspH/FimT family pseudopilin [Dyella subtropica]